MTPLLAQRVQSGSGATAFEDVKPDRAIIAHGRGDRFPKGVGIEAMGLAALLTDLAAIDG